MSITLDGTTGITTPDVETSDGAVYAKGNILGTVSEDGGVPTGAIIERGSNANGEFVRYADGTQICWRNDFALPFVTGLRVGANWTYPASFVTDGSVSVFHLPDSGGGASKGPDSYIATRFIIGSTSTSLQAYRVEGTDGWVDGDVISTTAMGIGRWF